MFTLAHLKNGTSVAAVAMLLATGAMAQTADTPTTMITTTETTTADAQVDTSVEVISLPVLDVYDTDQAVIDGLTAQGYEITSVERDGETYVVDAVQDGAPTVLVFSTVDGGLMTVDGEAPQVGSTDGEDPNSETPMSSDFSGQGDLALEAETGSMDGTETDPVAETIPLGATQVDDAAGDETSGQEADGGAETDGQG